MGGKTQQRVAGNAKPTSSGRIRELMINKQQGLSNIVTFSTLANNPKPIQKEAPIIEQQNKDTNKLMPDKSKKNENNLEFKVVDNTTSQSHDHKPKLVVRRVGNRDFFTRVRVPVDSLPKQQTPSSTSYLSQSESDKNDQSVITESKTIKSEVKIDTESKDNKNLLEEEIDNQSEELESKDEDYDEVYDFDSILNELSQIQDTCEIAKNNALSLNDLSDNQIDQECELIRLLKILVRDFREDLSIEEWDIVVKSIYKWSTIITQSEKLLDNSKWIDFCTKVFDFITQLISLAKQWKTMVDIEEKYPMMHLLLNDWDNFHSSKVYQDLILLYFKLISASSSLTLDNQTIIEALANIIIDVDPKTILCNGDLTKYSKDDKIDFEPDFKLPENHKYCDIDTNTKFKGFIPICNLLKSNHRITIVTAHGMLSNVMSILTESISNVINENEDDLHSVSLLPPQPLMSILTSRDSMMCALLSDYKAGDISVTIEPNTDAYTCTLSYLFVWDLIIDFIVGMSKEDGHRLIHCLKKLGLIQRLLDNIFMLLPPLGERDSLRFGPEGHPLERRILPKNDSDVSVGSTVPATKIWSLDDFLKSPLKTTLARHKNEIELTALHVYFSIALHMPVTVRKWYNNNSNKRLSNLVNEYTVKHISQIICTLEMETVHEKCQERANEDKSNNLIIKARPIAREVYAVYTRDEFKMELTIKLPINYPLGSVQIDGGKRVGVTDLKWRSWLLQLTTFLSHQNGPILDGIDLWRRNIDKRFEGIEKCMICFSILHSNYQLPKKKCITCTKMFHNLCLYKWFETSGNSTCPLCRNLW